MSFEQSFFAAAFGIVVAICLLLAHCDDRQTERMKACAAAHAEWRQQQEVCKP